MATGLARTTAISATGLSSTYRIHTEVNSRSESSALATCHSRVARSVAMTATSAALLLESATATAASRERRRRAARVWLSQVRRAIVNSHVENANRGS